MRGVRVMFLNLKLWGSQESVILTGLIRSDTLKSSMPDRTPLNVRRRGCHRNSYRLSADLACRLPNATVWGKTVFS